MTDQDALPPGDRRTLLGHPVGLFVLFFAELWERFCYYGMRALLALYVVDQFQKPQEEASLSYGAFTALIYATGILGGYVADRVLGYRRSILLGGVLMAIGEFTLLFSTEPMFLLGLATIVVGNGLFKPNISSLVGKLYAQGDPRRDAGFTIFYMGINIGAFLAPILCREFAAWMSPAGDIDYRYGFGLAGAGMTLGVLVFGFGKPWMQGHGGPVPGRSGITPFALTLLGAAVLVPVIYFLLAENQIAGVILLILAGVVIAYLLWYGFSNGRVIRDRILALIVLLLANVVFWASFEQAGNSLNFFARDHIRDLRIEDWTMPFEWFQSVNAIFIVLLGPVFAWLWVKLDSIHRNPSIPTKFGLGLVQVGLGFGVILLAIDATGGTSAVPWFMLMLLYLLHTTGELCVSPVGLSAMTKLAPNHMVGLIMGSWFLSIALANYAAGLFSSLVGAESVDVASGPPAQESYVLVFTPIFWLALIAGVVLLACSKLLNRLMHGIK